MRLLVQMLAKHALVACSSTVTSAQAGRNVCVRIVFQGVFVVKGRCLSDTLESSQKHLPVSLSDMFRSWLDMHHVQQPARVLILKLSTSGAGPDIKTSATDEQRALKLYSCVHTLTISCNHNSRIASFMF